MKVENEIPQLPNSWCYLRFEDTCTNVSIREKIPASEYLTDGNLPVIDQGMSYIGGYSPRLSASVDTELPVIVFGDHTRIIKYVDFPFAAGADGIKILLPSQVYHSKAFFHLLRSVKLPNKGYARHYQHLSSSYIPLPPFNEQKRIADKLDALLARVDACRERLDRIPAILKRFRQAVLAAASGGKLTEEWRIAEPNKEFVSQLLKQIEEVPRAKRGSNSKAQGSHDTSELFDLPDSWTDAIIESLCTDIVDCPHSTPIWQESGEICIRTTNFRPGFLDLNEVRYVSTETYANRVTRLAPKADDVLFSREGGILGIACLVPDNTRLCLGQRMMLMRTDKNILLAKYLMYVLNGPSIQGKIREKTGGSASPHLNVGEVKLFRIPLPTPAEQREIIRRVEKLFAYADRLEARYKAARAAVDRVTPALLAKAFRGELVPQEPNDEPAAELLARIQSAQSTAKEAKSKPRKAVSRSLDL